MSVPTLSELRKSAGQDPIPRSTLERLAERIRRGELPPHDTCIVSGRGTRDGLILHIECERKWLRGSGTSEATAFFARLLFGWLGTLITASRPRRYEEHGHEAAIDVPVPISAEFHRSLLRCRSQRKLKKLLREVPDYAKLLDEYPEAVVTPLQRPNQA